MFRPSDVRRVQAAFDAALTPPYEAQTTLEDDRKTLRVVIEDPDEARLIVAQAVWWFDESKARETKQPADAEIATILNAMQVACSEYPEKKAADAILQAEIEARQAALAAAKQAEAEASGA